MFGLKKKKKSDDIDKLKERFKNLSPGQPAPQPIPQPSSAQPIQPSDNSEQAVPQPVQPAPEQANPQPMQPAHDQTIPQPVQPAHDQTIPQPVQPAHDQTIPQPVQPAHDQTIPQPVQPTPEQAVPQPVQPTPEQAVPQPVQPTPEQAVPQPVQPAPEQAVPQPVQPTPEQAVPQPVQPAPEQANPQPMQPAHDQTIPQPVQPAPEQAVPQPMKPAPEQATQSLDAGGTNISIVDVTKLDNNEPEEKAAEEIKPIPAKPKEPVGELEDPKLKEIAENVEENFEEARMNNIIMQQLKELIEIDNSLNSKIKDVEKKITKESEDKDRIRSGIKMIDTKLQVIEKSMDQFMTLYEVVTNQFNPFIQQETTVKAIPQTVQIKEPEEVIVEEEPIKPSEDAKKYSIKDPVDGKTYEYAYDTKSHQAFLKKGDGWEESLLKEDFLEKHKIKEAAPEPSPAVIKEPSPEVIEKKPQDEATHHEEIKNLKTELEQEKLKNKVHQSHKAVLSNTIDGLKNDLADHKTIIETHKEENTILKSELDEHKEELDKHKEIIDDHKQNIKSKDQELQKIAIEADKCKAEKEQLHEHINGLKNEISDLKTKKTSVDPDQYFVLKNGQQITNLNDLVSVLTTMDKDTFDHHISPERNDFAIWVNDVLKDEDLAIKLIAITNKEEMIEALKSHLK